MSDEIAGPPSSPRAGLGLHLSHERYTWPVAAVSGTVGFLIGALVYPMWTDNVESAQVLAGVVEYPTLSAMNVYHRSVYTILIQSAAVLLRLGVHEWKLSVLYSGLQAALACSALSLATLALARSVLAAFLVPVLMLALRVHVPDWPGMYLAVFHGHAYPNLFPNHTSIYGVFGLFWVLLVFALFALGRVRSGALALGLMPAIHPGLMMACYVGALAAAIVYGRQLRPWRGRILRYGGLGLALTAATAAFQLRFRADLPDVPAADVQRIAEAFIALWDDHNAPRGEGSRAWFFESEYYTGFLCVALLTYLRRRGHGRVRLMLVALLAVVVLAAAYTTVLDHAPDSFHWRIRTLLITRWLNLSSWAFVILAVGVLGDLAFVRRSLPALGVLILALMMALTGYSVSNTALSALSTDLIPAAESVELWRYLRAFAFPVLLVAAAATLPRLGRRRLSALQYPEAWTPMLGAVTAGLLVVSLHRSQVRAINWKRVRAEDEWSGVLRAASGRPGLLLMGDSLWGIGRVQLRTRRPVLLDTTQLNMLLKVPKVGPRMEYVMRSVYDVEITEGHAGRELDQTWTERPLSRWQEIRAEFGVTDVLVQRRVVLPLPVVAEGDSITLYTIPAP